MYFKRKEIDSNTNDIFRTNYGKIDDKSFKLKFGDLLYFNIKNQLVYAVVLDIKKEDDGNWFGLCFLNKNNYFARRIPHGFGGECIEACDLTFINEKGLSDFTVVKNLKINFDKVIPGSDSPAMNLEEILRDYNDGIKNRLRKETPYKDKRKMLDPTNECYFPLRNI